MPPRQADKATLRALMREAAQKKEKKIDSPLVRYNELDQAVCRVCNSVVKSESLWTAHVTGKQHKENVERLKARAAKPPAASKAASAKAVITPAGSAGKTAAAAATGKASGSGLPADFFDTPRSSSIKSTAPSAKAPPSTAQANGGVGPAAGAAATAVAHTAAESLPVSREMAERAAKKARVGSSLPASSQVDQTAAAGAAGRGSPSLPAGFFDSRPSSSTAEVDRSAGKAVSVSVAGEQVAGRVPAPAPAPATTSASLSGLPSDFFDKAVMAGGSAAGSAAADAADAADAGGGGGKGKAVGAGKQGADVKGALPEGFFDDKAADHKARGVEFKKPDLQEELKEFERSIKVEVQQVEQREEEEEKEAADEREERDELNQRLLLQRIQELKRQKETRKSKLQVEETPTNRALQAELEPVAGGAKYSTNQSNDGVLGEGRQSMGQEHEEDEDEDSSEEGDDDADLLLVANWRSKRI